MKYPVAIHHEEGSAFGVTVPDIPGCFSAGDTFDEALKNTVEAIELHLEGLEDEGRQIPKASTVDKYLGDSDYKGAIWGFVEVDITPFLGSTEKINVTLPSSLIRKIDEKHKNRSKFLAEAAASVLSENGA